MLITEMSRTADLIINSATEFYCQLRNEKNGRYRSWEYCYLCFFKARKQEQPDVDYLSLQLAFYLASWGMYRGSSFLLQKDYRVHIPAVEELLKPKYSPLVGINCIDYKESYNQKLLAEINSFLRDFYDAIRLDVKETLPKNKLSDTLITKILMGTLGCVPAYDRYFIMGLKNQKVATGNYSMNSILCLVDFYEADKAKFEKARKNMILEDLPYPQMKLLDMGFWKIGLDLDNKAE